MTLPQDIKSLLFIVGGTVLLVLGAGEILFKLLIAIIGLLLISYGLRLRMPRGQQMPFGFIIKEWFFKR